MGCVCCSADAYTAYPVLQDLSTSSFLSGYGDRILAMERVQSNIELSGLNSEAAILLRVSDGQVLAQMNQEKRIYPASMTKMMTCIVRSSPLTIWKVRSAFRRRYFLRCMRKVRPWQVSFRGNM